MCNGTSVCDNKEDLRQCKNESLWRSLSDVIESEYVQCPGSSQWIKSGSMNNGIFDCLNRRDEEETTFKKTNSGNATQDWHKEVHKPCPKGEKYRRCLGNQPDKCVFSQCKFLLIIIRHLSKVKHTIGLLSGVIFLLNTLICSVKSLSKIIFFMNLYIDFNLNANTKDAIAQD